MTAKKGQRLINDLCFGFYARARDEVAEMPVRQCSRKQLRSCRADVLETHNFFVLRFYSLVVAVIDKETCICYDVLRLVYGYTATSAQHIAKFINDYGNGTHYTWRYIPGR